MSPVTYTFWRSGVLIGESDLEETPDHRRLGTPQDVTLQELRIERFFR